jgi:hypothetical protein
MDLSEYLKSLVIQIIKKRKPYSAVGPRIQKIQRLGEKATSVQSLKQKNWDSNIFCEFPLWNQRGELEQYTILSR